MDARHTAVMVIGAVVSDGRSLSALQHLFSDVDPPRDRALAMEIAYGVLRWRWRLDRIAQRLLTKPLKPRDECLRHLIWVGLYQLLYMRIPAHAAVAETVNTARSLDRSWAAGLVNACLRRFQREQPDIVGALEKSNEGVLSYPAWWLARLERDWPERWRDVAQAGNERAPMTVRVNRLRTDRTNLAERFSRAGVEYDLCISAPEGIRLKQPADVRAIPGFAEGEVSVQDEAAQLVPDLINLPDGLRVLDACAAPGGKACHLGERLPEAQIVAVDVDAARMSKLDENARRVGVRLTSLVGDVAQPASWWDGQMFDCILLDAPCSASGVVRRHPDIKSLRRDADIPALAETQALLLEKLWPLLRPGGILLYVTCSVFRAENDEVVADFLRQRADAAEQQIDAAWGYPLPVGRQVLPGEQQMDGFYFARLVKKNENG